MTVVWLVVWILSGTPHVDFFDHWNNWGIGLVVCVIIDLIGSNVFRR